MPWKSISSLSPSTRGLKKSPRRSLIFLPTGASPNGGISGWSWRPRFLRPGQRRKIGARSSGQPSQCPIARPTVITATPKIIRWSKSTRNMFTSSKQRVRASHPKTERKRFSAPQSTLNGDGQPSNPKTRSNGRSHPHAAGGYCDVWAGATVRTHPAHVTVTPESLFGPDKLFFGCRFRFLRFSLQFLRFGQTQFGGLAR